MKTLAQMYQQRARHNAINRTLDEAAYYKREATFYRLCLIGLSIAVFVGIIHKFFGEAC